METAQSLKIWVGPGVQPDNRHPQDLFLNTVDVSQNLDAADFTMQVSVKSIAFLV
jgi:hypothetical protein